MYSTDKVFLLNITLTGIFSQCNTINVGETPGNDILYIILIFTKRGVNVGVISENHQ